MPEAKPQVISILLHVAAILLLISIGSRLSAPRPVPVGRPVQLVAPRHRIAQLASARPAGGGGETAAPPRRGTPPPPAHRTFVLPVSRTVEDPRLAMQSTVIGAPARSSHSWRPHRTGPAPPCQTAPARCPETEARTRRLRRTQIHAWISRRSGERPMPASAIAVHIRSNRGGGRC